MNRSFRILMFLSLVVTGILQAQDHTDVPEPGQLSEEDPFFTQATNRWDFLSRRTTLRRTGDVAAIDALSRKCIFTLLNNRQGPKGGLKHEGIFPSYIGYRGFWAWDSWKHSFALAFIDPHLARNSIRAMFDYQDSQGMVADCIFEDTTQNNRRNTKPPLAAWAVQEIIRWNRDTSFMAEMLPLLVRYNRWWTENRDHDQNGLCEYGSTDGSLEAAKWESGWDNAVRFDSARMVRNNDHAWSMTQESADLNAYLYFDTRCIESMAKALHLEVLAEMYQSKADSLAARIQRMMWDEGTGFFYDIDLYTKKPVRVMEANGWIPLWAGIATKEQAARIEAHLMNPEEFNTFVPCPTVAANDPRFSPSKGYWRGPVWLDQAYFAVHGLREYGYKAQADSLTLKLLRNCEGLIRSQKPVRENYNPLTGDGLNADYFSWSAAAILSLILEY